MRDIFRISKKGHFYRNCNNFRSSACQSLKICYMLYSHPLHPYCMKKIEKSDKIEGTLENIVLSEELDCQTIFYCITQEFQCCVLKIPTMYLKKVQEIQKFSAVFEVTKSKKHKQLLSFIILNNITFPNNIYMKIGTNRVQTFYYHIKCIKSYECAVY